jgi:hypothetical protein
MDPISIATTVGLVLNVLYQVSERLHASIKDAKDSNNAARALAAELDCLQAVLEAMRSTLEGPTLKAAETAPQAQETHGLWKSVKTAIVLCQTSIARLDRALESVKPEPSGYAGQVARRVKFNLKDPEIQASRVEIRNHCDVISMALLMTNV